MEALETELENAPRISHEPLTFGLRAAFILIFKKFLIPPLSRLVTGLPEAAKKGGMRALKGELPMLEISKLLSPAQQKIHEGALSAAQELKNVVEALIRSDARISRKAKFNSLGGLEPDKLRFLRNYDQVRKPGICGESRWTDLHHLQPISQGGSNAPESHDPLPRAP